MYNVVSSIVSTQHFENWFHLRGNEYDLDDGPDHHHDRFDYHNDRPDHNNNDGPDHHNDDGPHHPADYCDNVATDNAASDNAGDHPDDGRQGRRCPQGFRAG